MVDFSKVSKVKQGLALSTTTIAFTVCFAVWTIFAIIGVKIKKDLGLSETEFSFLIGLPVLTGSIIRLTLGIWADQYGGRPILAIVMISSAIATWLLSYAQTYNMMLLAALGVGISGGSFVVGISYLSKWYPKENAGTALGIFGMGNIGAAVTKFGAPYIMVAFGWEMVAKVWAVALLVMTIIFWFLTSDEPELIERRAKNEKPKSTAMAMEPLKEIRVWRFSLYYFFVFGAFVGLALWLPRYYVAVYDLDIKKAGLLAASFSVAASAFRAIGGYLSDKFGARAVMYLTFIVSIVCLFILSYPSTDFIVHGIKGDIKLHIGLDFTWFTIIVFVLGLFMSFGKAAVYKHIPVYYPTNVGSV
ncbi:MAG: NarK/NasA family nitrate transporter, partial [Caulobacterales bacterium]|nr:NarK/NasA family nitrate transporter [Caulobacterales bacterium]